MHGQTQTKIVMIITHYIGLRVVGLLTHLQAFQISMKVLKYTWLTVGNDPEHQNTNYYACAIQSTGKAPNHENSNPINGKMDPSPKI